MFAKQTNKQKRKLRGMRNKVMVCNPSYEDIFNIFIELSKGKLAPENKHTFMEAKFRFTVSLAVLLRHLIIVLLPQ